MEYFVDSLVGSLMVFVGGFICGLFGGFVRGFVGGCWGGFVVASLVDFGVDVFRGVFGGVGRCFSLVECSVECLVDFESYVLLDYCRMCRWTLWWIVWWIR